MYHNFKMNTKCLIDSIFLNKRLLEKKIKQKILFMYMYILFMYMYIVKLTCVTVPVILPT